MKQPQPWTVEAGMTPGADAEATDLIGWCWGAPASVKTVTGTHVVVDVPTRTIRSLPKVAAS